MFSSIDKALVAAVSGVFFILNSLVGIDIGVSEDTLNLILGAATPLLVYLWPNKPWTEK